MTAELAISNQFLFERARVPKNDGDHGRNDATMKVLIKKYEMKPI